MGSAFPLLSPREARKRLRALRRNLPDDERRNAERAIHRELRRVAVWRPGRRVAVFLGMPGEVDLRPCFAEAWRRGVRLYVPRILSLRHRAMTFVPYERDARLEANWYGIDEPVVPIARRVGALQLDTILVPLLGFDAQCHRLGMGAGFYDRALQRRRDRAQPFHRPRLVGVAYAIQQLERIDPAPWDVALDMVVTERGVVRRPATPAPETRIP
ncbi:MAG TPA: 5-formyltetrahydrofolate cyclo-ligase [Burkholderiales bacterium]|nr:5-formyltetrahydrofolate cyclo-ligase [Burkholderiales bacterium]